MSDQDTTITAGDRLVALQSVYPILAAGGGGDTGPRPDPFSGVHSDRERLPRRRRGGDRRVTQLGENPHFGTHHLLNKPKRQDMPAHKKGPVSGRFSAQDGDTKTRFSTYRPHTRTHTHASYSTKVVSLVSPIGRTQ